MARPTVAFLDVNDTLSDLASVEPAFVDAGLRADDVRTWYLSVLRDGFAQTVLGDTADFAELGQSQLRSMLRLADRSRDVKSADVVASGLLRSFIDAAPHPTSSRASHRTRRRRAARLHAEQRFCRCRTSTARVHRRRPVDHGLPGGGRRGAWKPAPASYRHGLQAAGVDAADALMVAVHPWIWKVPAASDYRPRGSTATVPTTGRVRRTRPHRHVVHRPRTGDRPSPLVTAVAAMEVGNVIGRRRRGDDPDRQRGVAMVDCHDVGMLCRASGT